MMLLFVKFVHLVLININLFFLTDWKFADQWKGCNQALWFW